MQLVTEIKERNASPSSEALAETLFRAKLSLEELKHLLDSKIVKKDSLASQARKRMWLRNRSKIRRLHEALREHRINLLAAISANAL